MSSPNFGVGDLVSGVGTGWNKVDRGPGQAYSELASRLQDLKRKDESEMVFKSQQPRPFLFHAGPGGLGEPSPKGVVLVFYEWSGLSARDWAEAGYEVWCFDIRNLEEGRVERVGTEGGQIRWFFWDAHGLDGRTSSVAATVEGIRDLIGVSGRVVKLVLGFPPCDDLASSGAKHYDGKLAADPLNRSRAMFRVRLVERVGDAFGVPWCLENPVGVIPRYWRESNMRFDPWEFGGWLPDGDRHPIFPSVIPSRDAYWKRTCYWWGNGFLAPIRNPLPQSLVPEPDRLSHLQRLGSGSHRVKEIRSCSPRGVAHGVWVANRDLVAAGL